MQRGLSALLTSHFSSAAALLLWALTAIFGMFSFPAAATAQDIPAAPTITWPARGAIVGSNRPDITWVVGSPYDAYEVHIGSYNVPTSADGWDSGTVPGSDPAGTATSGPLQPGSIYYVFVRLHGSGGWGPWSLPKRHFYVAGQWFGDPYLVTDLGGQQRDHSIAFNPQRNEYLVAYMDLKPGSSSPYISAWRLDSSGARVGPQINTTGGVDGAGATAVAYGSVNGEYIIAGRDYHAHIFGQRINAATGALAGGDFPIRDASPTLEHAIGYAPTSDVFLEAWRDDGGKACHAILAQRVSPAGERFGSAISIFDDAIHCVGGPKITCNTRDDEFLVTYQYVADSDQQDLYAQRVRASDGVLLGNRVLVAGTSRTEWHNGIAFDSDMGRYLVAYESTDPVTSVWGQFLAADASLNGPRFAIAATPYNGGDVSVAWNAQAKEYLVAWLHGTSAANYARRISQTGTPLCEPFRINGNVTGIGNWSPLAVANPVNGEFLICWQSSHTDVYVRRYKSSPMPETDTTPPAAISGLAVSRSGRDLVLNWTHPPTPDLAGTLVRYKTTGFPTGPADGTLLADRTNAPGTTDAATHTAPERGTFYYAAFAYDEVPNHAPAATVSKTYWPADFDDDGDIDQSDFGHFQVCLSGSGQAYASGCADVDLDGDGDVDQNDFGDFQECMSGDNRPPGC